MAKLNPEPSRQFTDREVAKILGTLIGGLIPMSTEKDVKAAVQWWIDNWDQSMTVLRQMTKPQS